MKYLAEHNGQPIHAITLDSKEYKAKDGHIEVPDDHHAAHPEAASIGLPHASAKAPHEDGKTDDTTHGQMTHGRRPK